MMGKGVRGETGARKEDPGRVGAFAKNMGRGKGNQKSRTQQCLRVARDLMSGDLNSKLLVLCYLASLPLFEDKFLRVYNLNDNTGKIIG